MRGCSGLILLLAAVWTTVTNTQTQDFVFEKDKDYCTMKNGERRRCVSITSCPSALESFRVNPPENCGFAGTVPLVCCNNVTESVTKTTDKVSDPILDISSPTVTFECGLSNPRIIHVPFDSLSRSVSDVIHKPKLNEDHHAQYRRFDNKVAVVGGFTSKINAWPWMALLGERTVQGSVNWFCAGVLINQQWVLTALHCFHYKEANIVRLGEHDYNNNNDSAEPMDFEVAETILYPDYTFPQAYHDLALLKLAQKVDIQKYIRPVCLPWGQESLANITGSKMKLTGWGDTLFGGSSSSVLQEVDITILPSTKCVESYSTLQEYSTVWPRSIKEETICAGDPKGGKDACQGDSGGPLVGLHSAGYYTLAAVVSRGYGCGHKDYPGLYVNLRNPPYLAWIKKVAF